MLSLGDEWGKWWCCLCRLINLGKALIVFLGKMFPAPYFVSFYVLSCACVVLPCFFYVSFWTHELPGLPQPDLCYIVHLAASVLHSCLKPGVRKLYCIFVVTWHYVWPQLELQECGGSAALFPRQGTVCAHQGLQLSYSLNSF